jgi:putative transposase
VTRFRFIDTEKATHPAWPVATMCRLLDVSRSGYYAWKSRPPSARTVADSVLTEQIRAVHADSRGLYGRPRVHAELAHQGVHVGGKRVARLMRAAGLVGCHRRKLRGLTRQDPQAAPAPDLVDREFTASEPNQLWCSDVTYVPTLAGWLYLAVVIDVFSRRVVGWSMNGNRKTDLVVNAVRMAVHNRGAVAGVIHHSDRGGEYTSHALECELRLRGIRPSMGSVADCYDNALAESFFASLETELFDRSRFETHREARMAIFDYIEAFYNRKRLHSSLGYLSPAQYERQHDPQLALAC